MGTPDHFLPAEHRQIPFSERYRGQVDAYMRKLLESPVAGPSREMLAYQLGFILDQGVDEFKLRGRSIGKGTRGTLCLLTMDAMGGDWERAVPAAAALELFHNSTLILDDIQDNDETRRGIPTVWTRFGKNQAINAGFAGVFLSNIAVHDLFRKGHSAEMINLVAGRFADMGIKVANGQIMDIGFEEAKTYGVERDAYMKMIEGKTGSLVETAIMMGSDLADRHDDTVISLRQFAQTIGTAYQIADDLRGVWEAPEVTGKREAGDIARRKQSLPIVLAFEQANSDQRVKLFNIYHQDKPELDEADIAHVLDVLDELNIKAQVEAQITDLHSQAVQAIDKMDIEEWAKKDFTAVAGAISLKTA